jgi:hypothetical protein
MENNLIYIKYLAVFYVKQIIQLSLMLFSNSRISYCLTEKSSSILGGFGEFSQTTKLIISIV